MRFLADEGCDYVVVEALRAQDHDVVDVAAVARGATDRTVIELARRDERILLTEDKDFGQLYFAGSEGETGVILIRFPSSARGALRQAIVDCVKERGDDLLGAFTVVEPGRFRIRR